MVASDKSGRIRVLKTMGRVNSVKKALIIMGSVFLGFFLFVAACIGIVGEALETETVSNPEEATEDRKGKKKEKTAKIGDAVKVGSLRYTVKGTETVDAVKTSWGETFEPGSGEFLIVELTVENTGKKPITMDSTMTKLVDQDGNEYEYSVDASVQLWGDTDDPFLENINPKGKKTFKIAYDVSPEGKYSFLGSADLFGGDKAKIRLEK